MRKNRNWSAPSHPLKPLTKPQPNTKHRVGEFDDAALSERRRRRVTEGTDNIPGRRIA